MKKSFLSSSPLSLSSLSPPFPPPLSLSGGVLNQSSTHPRLK